jgi:hypothetical protein
MRELAATPTLTVHFGAGPDMSLALQSIPDLLAGLEKCTLDLQQFWNMTPGQHPVTVAAPVIGDVRELFTSNDYPFEALTRDQQGGVEFFLFIDEKGGVADCDVIQPSGIPALDGMGCQVMRERAKFKPALGPNGSPVRSVFVTPRVVWRIAS